MRMTDPDDLKPDMRRFQQMLAAAYAVHPPLDRVTLDEARHIVEQVRAPLAREGPTMVRRDDLVIETTLHGPLPLRVLRPTTAPALPALLYLHGGGWVYCSLDTHDRLMRELAARSGRVVIGVDYARAPQARCPVALEQTLAAWRWAESQAQALGIDGRRIALAGDSAGANLALAAAITLRDAGQRADALLLNYGVYSDDDDTDSFRRFDGARYTLERAEMRWFWQQYLGPHGQRGDARAMPLHAALHDLPRCCLVVAECDVLRDSSLALADRLRAAGVDTQVQREAGAPHSFLEAVSFSETADRALDRCGAWLRVEGAA